MESEREQKMSKQRENKFNEKPINHHWTKNEFTLIFRQWIKSHFSTNISFLFNSFFWLPSMSITCYVRRMTQTDNKHLPKILL